jgi:hypothetical protein
MLGMRHQAHDVPFRIDDAGDVGDGTVRVVLIAEDDLSVRLELAEEPLVGEPAALPVLDRDGEGLTALAERRERRVGSLDPKIDITTNERERRVRPERAREEAGLAEDLEAVADPEHRTAVRGELGDGSHRRRKARDGAAAEVVSVREPAGEDDPRHVGKALVGMPHGYRLRAERLESLERVPVVV